MAAMTVKEVVDDAEIILYTMGISEPDVGRLIRLASDAENDFAQGSFCLFMECELDTTADTYDYDLETIVAGALTGTQKFIRANNIKYNGYPLKVLNSSALANLPDWYHAELKDSCAMIGTTTLRLGFNPATVTDGLTFTCIYNPGSAHDALSDSFVVPLNYKAHLVNYVMWKYLDPIQPKKANYYEERYVIGAKTVKGLMKDRMKIA